MTQLRLVFDLDDTLYPERQFAISGFRACERWLAAEHGVAEPIVDRMTGLLDEGHMRSLFEITLAERLVGRIAPHSPALLEAFIDIYRLHPPEIALYDDAAPVLDHFAARGQLGLITDGQVDVQSSKVRALRLEPRFAHIVYTHALGRGFGKPHPHAFEAMERALGGTGRDVRFVYVGDNPAKDFVTPNARGWISVQVLRPQRIHARASPAEGGHAQHVIGSLAELTRLLG